MSLNTSHLILKLPVIMFLFVFETLSVHILSFEEALICAVLCLPTYSIIEWMYSKKKNILLMMVVSHIIWFVVLQACARLKPELVTAYTSIYPLDSHELISPLLYEIGKTVLFILVNGPIKLVYKIN